MNTTPGIVLPAQRVLDEFAHLRLDTTDLAPEDAAARILAMSSGFDSGAGRR